MEGERRETSDRLPLARPHLGTLLQHRHALDGESNLQLFGSQASAQSTELHKPGKVHFCKYCFTKKVHKVQRDYIIS